MLRLRKTCEIPCRPKSLLLQAMHGASLADMRVLPQAFPQWDSPRLQQNIYMFQMRQAAEMFRMLYAGGV